MNNRNYIMQAAIAAAFLASASVCAKTTGQTIGAATPAPVLFAQELVMPVPTTNNALTNASGALNLKVPTGFALSPSEVRYVRFELSNGAKFPSAATATGNSNCSVGAVNGLSTSAVTFSVTATTGSQGCDGTNILTLQSATIDNITNTGAVAATYSMKYYRPVSIYPTLSKIQNRLEKPIRQESLSIAKLRAEANSPWT